MAVADNAGVESSGISVGHSLPVTRTYPLPSVDASDSSPKQLFDISRLEQQAQHQQLQVLHQQELQQQAPETVQQVQQSKQTRSGPRPPPKQQLPPQQQLTPSRSNGVVSRDPEAVDDVVAVDSRINVSISMRELEDLTKLNPLAKEFVPPSHIETGSMVVSASSSKGNMRRQKNGYSNLGKRRANSRTNRAQREDSIRRTVYVSDIDQQYPRQTLSAEHEFSKSPTVAAMSSLALIPSFPEADQLSVRTYVIGFFPHCLCKVTEEQLAALFITCGQVVDCRVCGDPNSVLRFAFVEFTDEDGARAALSLAGTMLGYYPVRVLPSKTAIVPVNPTFLPRSEDEREMCARTIYCTNIDKKVSQADVKLFFESLCGEVSRLRLLGDYHHSTRIAFVEFVMAESAMAALNCSGAILGSLPIRVSPSKTPVRPRSPRPPLH